MLHDLPALKAANPLLQFMQQDGHVFRRVKNAQWTCLCPFHAERTPSFHVFEDDHHDHCYGCGEHGSIIDYVMKKSGCGEREAITQLAAQSPHLHHTDYTPPKPAPIEPVQHVGLPAGLFEEWQDACEALTLNPREIERIADWRGFSVDTILGAAQAQLLAVLPYFGARREAFLVEAPAAWFSDPLLAELNGPQQLLPHSIHYRLGPQTPNNERDKPSWRYDHRVKPSKSWPFLWGNPIGARWIFFLEGQWDALALADLCGWHTPSSMPPGTAIVGLRGATSWKLMLDDKHGLPLDPKATAIAIGDADTAGAKWYEKDGFLETLEKRVARLITYMPTHPGAKDFNDLTKQQLITGTEFLAWIRARLIRHQPAKRPALTFIQWCKKAATREDATGQSARLVVRDETRPTGRKSPIHWRTYWRAQHHAEADLLGLHAILHAWHTHQPPTEECRNPNAE